MTFSETHSRFIIATMSPLPFHILIKPTGALCNLNCKYCYYLSKEMLYPGSHFRMTNKIMEKYLHQMLEAHPAREITVAWQGGEPMMMGLDFFRRSMAFQNNYTGRGGSITNTIQTNGTLMDDEWAAFFKDNNFLVGISIDGPPEIHNCLRVDKGGGPTFDTVMKGLAYLQKHDVEFNILATVNIANVEHPVEVYRFLRDECRANYIQFIPIVERPLNGDIHSGCDVMEYSVKANQYGYFLIDVFNEWVRKDVAKIFVQIFDAALASWYGEASPLCVFSSICGMAPIMEHNGDIYSCDHFVDPAYKLGNILDKHIIELINSEQQVKFGLNKLDKLPLYCRECDIGFACYGGCPKDRFISTPDGEQGLNYLCEGYKLFFRYINRPMQLMAQLLRQQRSPAEIMQVYKLEDRLV
jgi:uncharacterized protein